MQDVERLALNVAVVDEMYERYRADPSSVDPSWRALFAEGAEPAPATTVEPAAVVPLYEDGVGDETLGETALGSTVQQLVTAYRTQGHLAAWLDPLGLRRLETPRRLQATSYALTERDLDRVVPMPVTWGGAGRGTVREILDHLRTTYAASIGVEIMHITSAAKRAWLWERLESSRPPFIDAQTQRFILERLGAAESFERFLHSKYVGTKRFSLEGSESLLPCLDFIIDHGAQFGAQEVVLGMAHRGRLNVLVHVLGKRPREIFAEFEDIEPEATLGAGDVKYHLGYSCDCSSRRGRAVHVSLTFNPSHLEAVDPIVVGRVRAKQRRRGDKAREKVLGVLVHGDAAFAGQGLVAETLNLSELRGYRTGGTVHVLVNNQIGFTTPPRSSRSTRYATDVAKMLECPIFHVNGHDPDALAHVVTVAMDYRARFHNDVVVDLWGFRKYGHNEADEPSFTQPAMYRRIAEMPSVFSAYGERLVAAGITTREEIEAAQARQKLELEREWTEAKKSSRRPAVDSMGGVWRGFAGGPEALTPEPETTGVPAAQLAEIAEGLGRLPEDFAVHPKVRRLLDARAAMGRGERLVDWAMAELLAFGSLVREGTFVRLSGQDSGRGTFSQRHATHADQRTGEEIQPLDRLAPPEQALFRAYDSPLSEAAVLGFEVGFAMDYPEALVVWEAQFGDFANGAQVIIDQFVAASEDKWKRLSGVVLLLPHGFEGQGPDHSSARVERFLQLASEDNLIVAQPSTAAQYFHLLRRQAKWKWRKPLVVFTPKSLLRADAAAVPVSHLTTGRFERVLDDPASPTDVARVLVCTGKVFHELAAERTRRGVAHTAIVRVEQLYPWPGGRIAEVVGQWPAAEDVLFVQEEPANMGSAAFVLPRLEAALGRRVRLVSRPESASAATGSARAHGIEQHAILDQAFGGAAAVQVE